MTSGHTGGSAAEAEQFAALFGIWERHGRLTQGAQRCDVTAHDSYPVWHCPRSLLQWKLIWRQPCTKRFWMLRPMQA